MKTIPWSTKPLAKAQDFPTMFVRMNHVESARTQTHFIVGTAASLATSFAQCLDFALPPCFSVVTRVCHLLMFVMGRLRVEMGQMRRIARIKVDHGCVREPFSKDHSHVFKVACGDGSDEENCKDQSGSWMCQGAIQQRS